MPQSQTIKSLPRLRLPSSLTRLVLPRATHRLTQLGAPYSECEGSLTVSEDHGQTRVLLSLPVNQSSHVSGRHYLKHCADCVFALPERPRHALGSSSSIAIDHLRRGSIDELRATPSGPVTAKWVPLQTSQKYGNQNSHSQTSTQQALTRSHHSDPLRPSPRSRLPLLLPRLCPPPADPQTPRPLQPIPAPRHHLLDIDDAARPILGFHHEACAAAGAGCRWAGGHRWGCVWR